MNEYNLFSSMIDKFEDSGAFSEKVIDLLKEELEQANTDGKLDDDPNYAPDEILLCELF